MSSAVCTCYCSSAAGELSSGKGLRLLAISSVANTSVSLPPLRPYCIFRVSRVFAPRCEVACTQQGGCWSSLGGGRDTHQQTGVHRKEFETPGADGRLQILFGVSLNGRAICGCDPSAVILLFTAMRLAPKQPA